MKTVCAKCAGKGWYGGVQATAGELPKIPCECQPLINEEVLDKKYCDGFDKKYPCDGNRCELALIMGYCTCWKKYEYLGV